MPESQTFRVLLFAVLRDAAGADALEVAVPAGAAPAGATPTVAHLLEAVAAQCPAVAKWLPHVRVAVNCAYAAPQQSIAPGDEIALIPPVAGG